MIFQGKKRKDVHRGDRVFLLALRLASIGAIALLVAIAFELFRMSVPAIRHFGLSFFDSRDWDPVRSSFGSLPFIYGTLVSSFLALLIACPISIGVGLFLSELAPRKVAAPISFLVDMLAAIPSVVYGLWGIFVLAPWLRNQVEPWLQTHLGFLPFFQGPPYGVGMLAAGIVLAIMITPTISAICREVFQTLPLSQREAALALGATRWEMIRLAVLKSAGSGVVGAIILGLGRALGETMAVTMVIGNRADISASLFAPGQTMASVIANEYAEATDDLHLSALATVGLVLFLVSFVVNLVARLLVWRTERRLNLR